MNPAFPGARGAGLVRRCELEVEAVQPPEDVGRCVRVAAVAGRAVVLLGDADLLHAVEDALEAHASFGTGEGAARAGVDATSEREVLAGVRAVRTELVRLVEAAWVAVGGTVDHH